MPNQLPPATRHYTLRVLFCLFFCSQLLHDARKIVSKFTHFVHTKPVVVHVRFAGKCEQAVDNMSKHIQLEYHKAHRFSENRGLIYIFTSELDFSHAHGDLVYYRIDALLGDLQVALIRNTDDIEAFETRPLGLRLGLVFGVQCLGS